MNSISIKVDEVTLNKMKIFYEDDIQESKNIHALFLAKIDDCTITAYKSMKVLFQGNKAEQEAAIWTTIKKQAPQIEKNNQYYLESIGSDEVGTGDYFGPVVVVSAFLNDEITDHIKALKIDDSKKITDEDIKKMAPTLFKYVPYSLLVVHNEKYNELMTQKNMNLNKLKAMLHKQAIIHLLNKIQQQPTIIIDQFCSIKNFNQYVNDSSFTKKIDFHTKAESQFASVACASIMARYIFLNEMEKLSVELNTPLLKGASNKVDMQGKELVKQFGHDILYKIAKLHFKNTDKINNLLNKN